MFEWFRLHIYFHPPWKQIEDVEEQVIEITRHKKLSSHNNVLQGRRDDWWLCKNMTIDTVTYIWSTSV